MKFSIKIFLGIVLILTLALSVTEYCTVSAAFSNSITHRTEEAMERHQLVKYALQSEMLIAYQKDSLNLETIRETARQISGNTAVNITIEESDVSEEDEYLQYRICETTTENIIMVESVFTQSGYTLKLITREDVSGIFTENILLQRNCQKIYLLAIGFGIILSLLLSWYLTRPIKRLSQVSKHFTDGDYRERIAVNSKDEIGELANSYNIMADTVEDKIHMLELSVQQKEDFMTAFAHELKTPMTSIIGYADMIYQGQLQPVDAQEAAGYILNEGLRLEALSFKLLELMTMDKSDYLLEETDLHQFLLDVYQTALPNARKWSVLLMVDCAIGYGKVEVDLLKTLVLNLIDNALKSGGTKVLIRGCCSGEDYWISIEDNGRGIPEGELKRITEAFYMVDKSRSRKAHGAGLGLALCKKIAEVHMTGLVFESTENVGTTVSLKLPLCKEEEE